MYNEAYESSSQSKSVATAREILPDQVVDPQRRPALALNMPSGFKKSMGDTTE